MNSKLILASSSPRRVWILQKFGYEFEVIPPENVREKPQKIEDTILLAEMKALSIKREDSPVLACDTIVVVQNQILGKPSSFEEAKKFIRQLSGRWHEVYTGYVIVAKNQMIKKIVKTRVKFSKLHDDEIMTLLKYDNVLDKAGAYGIQGLAGLFIEKIEGSYYNVVGLPIEFIYRDLKSVGVTPVWEKLKNSGKFL
ncbi:MAG: nucleoside triphosphate pyrophosphatase [candidate division WOR-3 bacterium]